MKQFVLKAGIPSGPSGSAWGSRPKSTRVLSHGFVAACSALVAMARMGLFQVRVLQVQDEVPSGCGMVAEDALVLHKPGATWTKPLPSSKEGQEEAQRHVEKVSHTPLQRCLPSAPRRSRCDNSTGATLRPVLLRCASARRGVLGHSHRAFGRRSWQSGCQRRESCAPVIADVLYRDHRMFCTSQARVYRCQPLVKKASVRRPNICTITGLLPCRCPRHVSLHAAGAARPAPPRRGTRQHPSNACDRIYRAKVQQRERERAQRPCVATTYLLFSA